MFLGKISTLVFHLKKEFKMLVLSRKTDEAIQIQDNIKIRIISIERDRVKLGIEAPKEIKVNREEVYEKICREKFSR
jgi:carbon storage regulator